MMISSIVRVFLSSVCIIVVSVLTNSLLVSAFSTPTPSLKASVYDTIKNAKVVDPRSGSLISPIISDNNGKRITSSKSLVVILPQLGEFDSLEFCEQLAAIQSDLEKANINLSVIGIGNSNTEDCCAKRFSDFTGLSMDWLLIDPNATLHQDLDLHAGPRWDIPDFISDDVLRFLLRSLPGGKNIPQQKKDLRSIGKAWLNYLAMCAGISAPGTLQEILRGYFGDISAPERFASDDVVKAGFITIGPGVGPVQMGPMIRYTQWFADETGYQRPVELATVRLKNMVEVLTKWDTYVSNPALIDRRGATYLIDHETGEVLYEYKHRGVLTYSETMPRPLSFLAPYIGEKIAKNPLRLPDNDGMVQYKKGRGILKPIGKLMNILQPIFHMETKFQAKVLSLSGSENDNEDINNDLLKKTAREQILETVSSNRVVVYTYGLSPFSIETIALLEEIGYKDYKKIELGPEWFLLGKKESIIRAELLEMTGQSSLPHIFIDGEHIGGLFSGGTGKTKKGNEEEYRNSRGGGLAYLRETGELQEILA